MEMDDRQQKIVREGAEWLDSLPEEEQEAVRVFMTVEGEAVKAIVDVMEPLSPDSAEFLAGIVERARDMIEEPGDGSETIVRGIAKGMREYAAFKRGKERERS